MTSTMQLLSKITGNGSDISAFTAKNPKVNSYQIGHEDTILSDADGVNRNHERAIQIQRERERDKKIYERE